MFVCGGESSKVVLGIVRKRLIAYVNGKTPAQTVQTSVVMPAGEKSS